MNTHDIKLPPLRRPQVPRIDADIDLADVRRLADWCEKTARSYARAAVEADRKTTAKQLSAYELLVASLEAQCTHMRKMYDELKDRTNPDLLASERAANAILTAELEADRNRRQIEAEEVCAEAYQVVGNLLSDLGIFETPHAEKILDNLSQAKMVHDDVLPWPTFDRQRRGEPVAPEGFRLIAVNETFDSLTFWLDRCEQKGHLENCADLVEPWEAFEYREVEAPQPAEPVTIPQTVVSDHSGPVKVLSDVGIRR